MRLGRKQNPSAFRMRMALRICGALLTTVLAGSALALEGAVESVESLKEYAGIWAHSDADCKAKMSGRLDQDGVDRVTSSSYELVGICADGIDLLHQPVNCGASGFVKQDDLLEFSAACRIKDFVDDTRRRVLLKVQDADTIFFADPAFMVFGRYVRCSRQYTCEKAWNTE